MANYYHYLSLPHQPSPCFPLKKGSYFLIGGSIKYQGSIFAFFGHKPLFVAPTTFSPLAAQSF